MASKINVDKIARGSGTPEFTIPTADGTAGQAIVTNASGILSFADAGPSLTGSTNTWIPTITGANALTGTANFTYDGNTLDVKNSGTASDIKVYCETANSHYTSIKSAAHAAYTGGSWTMTLPGTDGNANEFLQTNGAGVTSWASAGNSPAFWATLATSQSIPDNTVTKITMDTEEYDSAGDYDHTTNYRFTPTTAGTYYLFAALLAELSDQMYRFQVYIKKNGSNWLGQTGQGHTAYKLGKGWVNTAGIDTANGTSDYYEVFVWGDTGNGSNSSVYGNSEGAKFANFGGFKIG